LYQSAVKMLEETSPGYVRFVSHAVREIVNGLPGVLYKDFARGNRLQYPDRLDEILDGWPRESGFGPSAGSPNSSAQLAISPRVVALWRSLLDDHLEVSRRLKKNATGLFIAAEVRRSGREPTEADVEPAVEEWLRMHKWFVKHVHESKRPINASDFKTHFQQFEQFLRNFYQAYSDVHEGLDDVLAKTNS
jgi:hypothetical protein